jgi:hypothetical protein
MSVLVPTSLQQEDWLRSLSRGGRMRSMPCRVRVSQAPERHALRDALAMLLAEQPALRTRFFADEPTGAVVLPPPADPPVVVLEHGDDPVGAARAFATEPFGLGAEARIRAASLTVGEDDHSLIFGIDHLCADLASQHLLVSRIGELLGGDFGRPLRPDDPGPYARFADQQRAALDGVSGELVRSYWQRHFARWGAGRFRTPFARDRPGSDEGTEVLRLPLAGSTRAALAMLARRHRTSRFVVVAAALLRAQLRQSGAETAGISTDFHGRVTAGVAEVVGLFSHGLRLPLDRREADDLDQATVVTRDRLAAMSRAAMPLGTAAHEWARQTEEATSTGPDLYFVAQPRPASPADDRQLAVADLSALTEAAPDRLQVELAGVGSELYLDVRMHRGTFDVEHVRQSLAQAMTEIEGAALVQADTGRTPR